MNNIDFSVCEWSEPYLLVFSDNVWGDFIYYSHFFPAITGIVIALVVFSNSSRSKPAQALLAMSAFFAIWSFFDMILWSHNDPSIIMFFWSSLIYFEILVYIAAFFFAYSYFYESFPKFKINLLFFVSLIPLFFFSHTAVNLSGFDFTNCWREVLEGPLITHYLYPIEVLILISIIYLSILGYKKSSKNRFEAILVTASLVLFLGAFSAGNIVGALEINWEIGQYGLFGMPIFASILAYSIVKYQTFKINVIAVQALLIGMIILLLSQLFVRTIENARIITLINLFLFTILGLLFIRSVKKEIKQREEIEELAHNLERTNERLKMMDKQKSEFVSIASHQLRSPLTAIRGYISMMQEGNFGVPPETMKEPMKRIAESSRFMATSIDDFLNVSRIESGNMKYEYTNFDLVDLARKIVDDLQSDAGQRQLLLLFRTNLHRPQNVVNADIGKMQQILHNLVNNALKYTLQGSVTIYVHDNPEKQTVSIDVIDTGLGMSAETIQKLFGKFTRAKIASSANIMGTGLGLFVAREMARAMKGEVTAFSEGEGKGSKFTLTMPYEVNTQLPPSAN